MYVVQSNIMMWLTSHCWSVFFTWMWLLQGPHILLHLHFHMCLCNAILWASLEYQQWSRIVRVPILVIVCVQFHMDERKACGATIDCILPKVLCPIVFIKKKCRGSLQRPQTL
jgi:hypothetical protein